MASGGPGEWVLARDPGPDSLSNVEIPSPDELDDFLTPDATDPDSRAGCASTSATLAHVSALTALNPAFQASFSQAATRMSRRSW